MKLTVKQKLMLSFGSVIALMVLTVGFIFTQVRSAHNISQTIEKSDVPSLVQLLFLVDEVGDVQKATLAYIQGDEDAKAGIHSNYQQFETYFNVLYPLQVNNPGDQQKLDRVKSLMSQYMADLESKILPRVNGVTDSVVIYADIKQLDQRYLVELESTLDGLVDNEILESEKALAGLTNNLTTIEQGMLIATLIAALVASVIAYRLSNSLIRRIEALDQTSRRIAQGDLTMAPLHDNSGDELAHLASSVNEMQNSLRSLIGSISEVGAQVQDVTISLSQASDAIVDGANQQASKSHLIATASEELSLTISEVSQHSTDTADSANQSGDAAQNGQHVIAEMVTNIQQVSTQMEDLSGKMEQLGQRSEEIGSVIKVIKDIAEQTNLLALNAAIEAARAGEFGRGFAVVADEVRALAERTTKATQEVSNIIEAIQQGTREAVNHSEESRALVEIGVTQSAGAGSALEQIVASTEEVMSKIHTIATATEEQSHVTREIASDVTVINDLSQQALAHASESSASVSQLTVRVQELEALINRFRLS
ncbi:hypothetical protein VST7929_00445 [Vibrio stylophorae]|uniref:Methyl-accepting chemotaxis protein n=1 Tax=Vibrio stylophorae TaxID=659351 RepID=A0ABM8ZQW8_9VIBR|nr:methyl-accepting chemotaxis protein [Vibrio stylophorae]CAH0532606.1 hypothetical protein VST7929_00445 [Vibrio stylophorae]